MPITLPEMHSLLVRVVYPATRDEIAAALARDGAPEEAIARVRTLPPHRYGSTDTVMEALRGLD